MEKIKDKLTRIRATNLTVLGKEFGRVNIAERCGYKSANHIHNLCSGNSDAFGSGIARKIETAMGLPELWLDKDRPNTEQDRELETLMSEIAKLSPEHRQAVIALVNSLNSAEKTP